MFGLLYILFPLSISANYWERQINCPSGHPIYYDPLTRDVKQCAQEVGHYSFSCPIGTACERFAIDVPGFRDFCCYVKPIPIRAQLYQSANTRLKHRSPTSATTAIIDKQPIEMITNLKQSSSLSFFSRLTSVLVGDVVDAIERAQNRFNNRQQNHINNNH